MWRRKLAMQVRKTEFWATVISVVALAVSAMTWQDVHAQLRLISGQIRAYVQVVDVRLLEPITDSSFIRLQLRLKNLGQTATRQVYGEMDYDLGIPDVHGNGNEATGVRFGSMGPGLERLVTLQSNRINRRDWPTPYPRQESVYFFGTVWFVDDTTGEQRKEDWCYELPLTSETSLKRTDLEQCAKLTYKSNDVRKINIK